MAGPGNKNSPFAALAALRDKLPEGPKPPPDPSRPEPILGDKIVVARTKKGRGGKTVTTIAGVLPEAREDVAKDLRRAFGCGTSVEDELIVVQGDQVPRVRGYLESRGVRKVIIGS